MSTLKSHCVVCAVLWVVWLLVNMEIHYEISQVRRTHITEGHMALRYGTNHWPPLQQEVLGHRMTSGILFSATNFFLYTHLTSISFSLSSFIHPPLSFSSQFTICHVLFCRRLAILTFFFFFFNSPTTFLSLFTLPFIYFLWLEDCFSVLYT